MAAGSSVRKDRAVAYVARVVGGRDGPLAAAFAERLLERAPDTLFDEAGSDALVRTARWAWGLFARRRPDALAVRLDREGPVEGGSVLAVSVDDMPFLYRTVREAAVAAGRTPRYALHPVLGVLRDRRGRPVRLAEPVGIVGREAFLLLVVEAPPGADLRGLERSIRAAIGTLRAAVADFGAMRACAEEAAEALAAAARGRAARGHSGEEAQEAAAFLRYLADGGFVFLGARPPAGPGLGLLRGVPAPAPRARGPLLEVGKAAFETLAYRRGRPDEIVVRLPAGRGRPAGVLRLVGWYATRTELADPLAIPVLRRKIRAVMEAYRVVPGSHDEREIRRLFHTFPRETLFATPPADLLAEVEVAIETGGAEVRTAVRHDPARRGTAVTIVMPRERFTAETRRRIESCALRAIGGAGAPLVRLALDPQADVARFHLFFEGGRRLGPAAAARLRREIAAAARRWRDRLEEALAGRLGRALAAALVARYEAFFDEAYRVTVSPDLAARDVEDLERLRTSGAPLLVSFGRETDHGGPCSVIKVLRRGARSPLSAVVPALTGHALTVLDEAAFEIGDVHLQVLLVRGPDGRPIPPAVQGDLIASIEAVLAGTGESDRMNGLIVTAGLRPREVARFRALHGYFRQTGAVHTRRSVFDALLAHPRVVRALCDLWAEKFDPGRPDGRRAAAVEAARRRAEEALAAVGSLDEDRILRAFLTIIEATVRTNEWLGRPAIAFKVDGARLPFLRGRRPWREVWVESPTMAGCHIRFGPIARGGIRWSDRPDDVRTEILDLARTQVVKNAQIVPTGAKGGFVCKRPPADRAAVASAGVEAYRTLIGALLDLADDRRGGRVVPRPLVVRHDGDDPYIVVAADKGTATFSDIANAIAKERGFWLGDAFASGGSRGYDHKKEAITAAGAWACVKRHFREAGLDPERTPFTVVGIGDMSGDVFGNGLLLMRRARLVAAFDHRHVFIDPDPDPERSWRERRRLFRLPRSSWADYDRKVLSRGGGVWGRTEKAIRLPEPARRLLGLPAGHTDGEALIRAVLSLDVDLLWNGGIGTYVKASDETHAEVGDPANDGVRIDASNLRARIVGEGGNLGLTQRARLEAARRGVRLNTDAIDNAGGVHLSDKEVNLKILLAGRRDRDRVLAAAKREVIEEVLDGNRAQSLAISMDVERSRLNLADFSSLASDLERRRILDRRSARLPDAEAFADRMRAGEGLLRPEAAVLLAHAKIDATRRILESPILTRPEMDRYVAAYFPAAALRVAASRVGRHALRNEILATALANRFVNHHGAAALWRHTTDLGLAASRVILASLRAEEILEALELRAGLEPYLPAAGPAPYADLFALEEAVARATRWIVRHGGEGPAFDRLGARFRALAAGFLPPAERARLAADAAAARARGLPGPLAARVAALRHLRSFLDVVDLARHRRVPPAAVGRLLYGIGERLGYPAVIARLEAAPAGGEWDRAAAADLVADLRQARRRIAERVLDGFGGRIDRYLEMRFRSFDTVRATAARIEAGAEGGLAPFVVFADQVNNLAAL